MAAAALAHKPGPLLPPGVSRVSSWPPPYYPRVPTPPPAHARPLPYTLPHRPARRLLSALSGGPREGKGAGSAGGCDSSRPDQCQLQPRFSARCQLAHLSGTEVEVWDSLLQGGGSPPRPLPSTHLKGASPPRPLPWRRVQLGITLVTSPGASSPHPSRSNRGLAEGLPPPQPFARARRAVRA